MLICSNFATKIRYQFSPLAPKCIKPPLQWLSAMGGEKKKKNSEEKPYEREVWAWGSE